MTNKISIIDIIRTYLSDDTNLEIIKRNFERINTINIINIIKIYSSNDTDFEIIRYNFERIRMIHLVHCTTNIIKTSYTKENFLITNTIELIEFMAIHLVDDECITFSKKSLDPSTIMRKIITPRIIPYCRKKGIIKTITGIFGLFVCMILVFFGYLIIKPTKTNDTYTMTKKYVQDTQDGLWKIKYKLNNICDQMRTHMIDSNRLHQICKNNDQTGETCDEIDMVIATNNNILITLEAITDETMRMYNKSIIHGENIIDHVKSKSRNQMWIILFSFAIGCIMTILTIAMIESKQYHMNILNHNYIYPHYRHTYF